MRWILCALLVGLSAAGAGAEGQPFHVLEIAAPGRTAAAGLADLDGDGRSDLYAVSLTGIPPNARRELRVYFQAANGTFREKPDWKQPLDEDAAAYDLAEIDGAPGIEFLQLRRHAITLLSFRGQGSQRRELAIPGDPTAAVAPDERGVDRLRIARDLGDGVRLLVPGLGECIVLTPDGELVARLDAGQRANYFIPKRPGPLLSESELESYYDFPRTEVADANGDGRGDLIFASRHELRVFLQDAEGGFRQQPSQRLALGRLSEKDLIRGSGNVRVAARDVDGDGRADLLITSTTGGLMNARSETTLHLNRNGTWDLDAPQRRSGLESGWSTLQVVDVDGDGSPELLEARIPLSILELVEALLTREADVHLSLFRSDPGRGFRSKPWVEMGFSVGLDFETLSLDGFAPTLEADVNGDGWRDRVSSDDGTAIEVYLGGGEQPFQRLSARQELDTHGSLRFGDVDGDGLMDLLLFSRDRPDSPIRLLVNRGALPGTPRREVLSPGD